MFSNASNFTQGVDFAFLFIFGVSFVILVAITTVMIYFVVKYSRKRHPKPVQIKDNMKLELAWIIIPFILVMLMFYYGYIAYAPMRNVPKDAYTIKAVGKMWNFTFVYEGKKESIDTLVVPINKPIKIHLVSKDVGHAFYIPAFRVKEDMVPGKDDGYCWFIAQEIGEYDIFCAEYCGVRHSYMIGKIKVVQQAEFDKFVAELKDPSFEHEGLAVLKKNACNGCHSVDGSKLVGSSFKGLYGTKRKVMMNGSPMEVEADSSYVFESILEPDIKIVDGFNKGLMRSYKGVVTQEDMRKIVEYLKTIK